MREIGRIYLSLGVVPPTADLAFKPMSGFGEGVVSIGHTMVLRRQMLVRSPITEDALAVRV